MVGETKLRASSTSLDTALRQSSDKVMPIKAPEFLLHIRAKPRGGFTASLERQPLVPTTLRKIWESQGTRMDRFALRTVVAYTLTLS